MSEYRTPPEAPKDRRRIWLIRGVVALALYALLGFFGVPALIKWQLPKQAGEQLGRVVSLDEARFNPFTLNLELEGLRIREADGASDAFSLGRIATGLQWKSLFYWGLIFGHLEVDAPKVSFTRLDETHSNWSDVIERVTAPGDTPAPKKDENKGPLRFSVNNIRLTNGEIDIDDRPAGLTHTVRALNIGVPFISGFPAEVEHFVKPELSANINGTPLTVSGRTRPFDAAHTTVVDIQLAPFDIAPYLAYLPYKPAFSIRGGQLSTALELAFEQPTDAAPRLTLVGSATLAELALVDHADGALLALPRLDVTMKEYDVFAGIMHLGDIKLNGPEVRLARAKDGRFNWEDLIPPKRAPAPAEQPASAAATPTEPPAATEAADAPGQTEKTEAAAGDFHLTIDHVGIADGRLAFTDAGAPAGAFETTLTALDLSVDGLDTASETPATVKLTASTAAGERLAHEGSLTLQPLVAQGRITLASVPLTHYAPYFANQLADAAIEQGVLEASIPYRFAQGNFKIEKADAQLANFALRQAKAKAAAVSVAVLAVKGLDLDVGARQVRIGAIQSTGGAVKLARLRDGSIDLAAIAPPAAPAPAPAPNDKPFGVRIDGISLSDWATTFTDHTVSPAMSLDVEKLKFDSGAIDLAKPGETNVSLEAVLDRTGYLAVKGQTRLDTFDSALRVDLKGLDLRSFARYIPQAQAIDIRSARAGLGGQLSLEKLTTDAPQIRYRGDVAVTDLIARDTINDTDFLRWKSLSLNALAVSTAPLNLAVGSVKLADFYSRLILDAKGRLNFRELTGAEPAPEPAATAGEEATAVVSPPSEALPPIRIGKIEVANGNVQYSDRFVQPNYDANLTEVNGALDDLRSEGDSVATLSLTAALDHGAPVEVTGQLNPLRQDRYLDILATVRDFQLPSISTYAGKYVGYGIAKGILSADLTYKINDRVLTAQNHVLLDQLTFGDKVESKDAVNLPVQLAVALLKNGKGEIDLSVPVSGTLDDPKFSIGGLVARAFFNLIAKAITSPFALLGSVFGGGEELAYIDYSAGTSTLSDKAVKKLETLAKALADRPALKIEITGRVDPQGDAQGLRTVWLENRMREVLRDQLINAGKTPPALEQITLPSDQQDALLKEAYDEADIEKPRNAIGFAKSLPPDQMRALMLQAAPAGPAELADLAKHRAQTVRDWLVGVGKVNAARIFLVPPKASDKNGNASRVDFSLR